MASGIYLPLSEYLDLEDWPFGGFLTETLSDVYIEPPEVDEPTGDTLVSILLPLDASLQVPGLDFVALALGSGAGTTVSLRIKPSPVTVTLEGVATLRVDANVLHPVKPGTRELDTSKKTLDIPLGAVDIGFTPSGDLDIRPRATAKLPKCMVGSSGVLIEATSLRWISSGTDFGTVAAPANMPAGFTGLFLDGVTVDLADLAAGTITMKDVFLGTGGFSGTIDWTDTTLAWNSSTQSFSGALVTSLFGFKGGLSRIKISFRQSAFTECEISGDVFVPYLDKRVGLTLGLDGNGGFTAAAGLPVSKPPAAGVAAGKPGYLLHLDVGTFLSLDVDALHFEAPAGGTPALTISGGAEVTVAGFTAPPFGLKGLRIDAAGKVAIVGGWIDLESARSALFNGFPLEITRIGFGAEDSGRQWIGLNGGLKLAEGLPLGASVEGLRISWDPKATNIATSVQVSLGGIGLEVKVPGAFEFKGEVAFFTDTAGNKGFRGHVTLQLIPLKLTVDASLVVGRTPTRDTFFYLYLGVDLPAGIPIFNTGAAFYGFAGLVATNMQPDKAPDEHWYYGYYLREPKGVTDAKKWRVQPGAFAGGLGTTLGTAPDDGFSFSAKVLLVLLLPGPQLILQGKASFVKRRPSSTDVTSEGALEGLIVLDIPAKLFQANLAAVYKVPLLLDLGGGLDVAFTWAPSPPPTPPLWHVFLGEKTPMERRITGSFLEVLHANAYFQLTRPGIELGAWIGINEQYQYGPARAWLQAELDGAAAVSWNPQQFNGTLSLDGDAGLSAFGVNIQVILDSDIMARGPSPWYVSIEVELEIKIDIWFFHFHLDVGIKLTWGDPNQPLPSPVTPVVLRLAAEHMKADEARDLSGATVPPDVRPVVLFNRPVRDIGQIGAPLTQNIPADVVGPRTFQYALHHVALIRRNGSDRTVAAAGVLKVANGGVSLPGQLALPGVTGGTLEVGGAKYPITGSGTGTLSITGSVADGTHSYRVRGRQAQVAVQIKTVTAAAFSTSVLTLAADPGEGKDAFANGKLKTAAGEWTVLGNDGIGLTIRTPTTVPAIGAGTLIAPLAGVLEGQWLPVDDKNSSNPVSPTTKLMVWARTPFAWFRRNDSETLDGFDLHNDAYACGPESVEEPVCLDFDDLAPGMLTGAFTTELIPGTASGNVAVATAGTADRYLVVGPKLGGYWTFGSVTLRFDPPIEAVIVRCFSLEGGMVTARRGGAVIASAPAPSKLGDVQLAGEIDQVEIKGTMTTVTHVCFLPGWTCVKFEEASFPQKSTGRQTYAGLGLETTGTMEVKTGILSVTAPKSGLGRMETKGTGQKKTTTSKRDVLPGVSDSRMVREFGLRPSPKQGDSALAYVGVPGVETTVATYLPGLGATLVGPLPIVARHGVQPRVPIIADRRIADRRMVGVLERVGIGGGSLPELPGPLPPPESPPLAPPGFSGNPKDLLEGKILVRDLRVATVRVETDGTVTAPPLASLAILLPQPVTRVRVHLVDAAEVIAYAGTTEIARKSGVAGEDVLLRAGSGWLDRVIVLAPANLRINRCCYDAGPFGWKRFEQWAWRRSIQQSIESLYREEPILAPGNYRLEVITSVEISGPQPGPQWFTESALFTVGPPPGLGTPTGNAELDRVYPNGGPLNDLGTYVAWTLPGEGERPFYRRYDVGVGFNESYVSRMFIAAQSPITVAVMDSNDVDRRQNAPNLWGNGPDLELSQSEETWIKTLHGDGTSRCAQVDRARVMRDEGVLAGAGEMLDPAELHAGELRAGTKPVYRFEFVTSRFADFRHQMATFDGRCRVLAGSKAGPSSVQTFTAPVVNAAQTLATAISDHATKRSVANTGSPSKQQLDAYAAARVAVVAARRALASAREKAFDSLWSVYFSSGPSTTLPNQVEVARVRPQSGSTAPDLLLVESPEPMHWERLSLQGLGKSSNIPLRRRGLAFDAKSFGAPDIGTFRYGALEWTTSHELRVADGAVTTRVAGQWVLTIKVPRARSVALNVRVTTGGSAKLKGTSTPAVTDITQGPTGTGATAVMKLSGALFSSVELSGTGISLVGVTVEEDFQPEPARGDLRLARLRLPNSATDNQHAVDLTAYRDTDLTGWSIRWFDAFAPATTGNYHNFAPGTSLKDGRVARIYGGLGAPPAVTGFDVYAGGAVGVPPLKGAVFQLIDPQGRVANELVALPDSAYTNLPASTIVAAVNVDGTRALLVPTSGTIDPGHWRLKLRFNRDAGPELPLLSVGAITDPEDTALVFTTE